MEIRKFALGNRYMGGNVKHSALSGAKWNAFGKFGHHGVQFFVSIILARILAPEEFGLIAMLTIFMSVSNVFIASGLGTALIQKKKCTDEDYSTVFYFNIAVSTFFYLLLFFTAPLIANFYGREILISLTRLQALTFLINSFGMVQGTILSKELNFKKLNIVSVIGVLGSAIVAIFMAYNDYGVYAIVGQNIVYALLTNIIYWVTSKWKPLLRFSKKSFRELFGYGSKLLASGILDNIYTQIDSLLIGKVFSPATLGQYTRAKTTKNLPIDNTTSLLSSTLFPIFSKIETDEELASVTLKFYNLFFYVVMPMMIGLMLVAEPFVVVLFSDKWLPCVPYLQILCISGFAYPLSVILCQTIMAKGQSGIFLKLEIWKKIFGLIPLTVGIYFGIYYFLFLSVFISFISLYLNIYFTSKVIHIKKLSYFTRLLPSLGISVVMGLIVYASSFIPIENRLLILLIMTIIGIISYIVLSEIFKIKEYYYLKNTISDLWKNRKSRKNAEKQTNE